MNMIDLFAQVGAVVPVVGVPFAVSVFVFFVSLQRTDVPDGSTSIDGTLKFGCTFLKIVSCVVGNFRSAIYD